MRIRHFLPLAAIALPLFVSARPAAPGLRTLSNADGSNVEAYVYGDESFSWTVSADGKMLLEYDGSSWIPVKRDGAVLKPEFENIELLRSEQPGFYEEPVTDGKKRMAPLDVSGRSTYPTIGENIRSCVVLIEYADTKFTVPDPKATFEAMCNEEGFSKYNAKGSARDYYIATSNGQFKPTFDVYGPVQVSNPAVYYVGRGSGLDGDGKNAYFGYAIKEALEILEKQGVDFSVYDYDDDGTIDNIFFFYAGFGQADSGNADTVWPHQSDWARYTRMLGMDPITLSGKKFATYACSNELQGGRLPEGESHPYLDGIGAFAHEFAHVLGLPDLYDTNTDNRGKYTQTPSYWDVMDQGTYNDSSTRPPYFSAYEQWVCRWLEYEDIRPDESGHYDVPSLSASLAKGETPKAYRLRMFRPASTTSFFAEYFLLETRTHDGWDVALPGEGILLWHINFDRTKWLNNQVNYNGESRAMFIRNSHDSDVWPGEEDKFENMIYTNGPTTLPYTSASDFNPVITAITFDKDAKLGSFNYNTETQVDEVTVLNFPEIYNESAREIRLSWEPVEGIENYYVTVTRTQGSNTYYVDGYNEKAVGNVSQVIVRNISPAAWNQQMTAYVRCGNDLPGKKSSNNVRFVPSALSSVDEITLGSSVRGCKGYIEAPEGARVFNISGIETGTDNLPAGVYMVVLEGKSAKVVVK